MMKALPGSGQSVDEMGIRARTDSLCRRVQWTWFVTDGRGLAVSWGPEPGWLFSKHRWSGLDQSILLHVLALGSATHPVDAAVGRH